MLSKTVLIWTEVVVLYFCAFPSFLLGRKTSVQQPPHLVVIVREFRQCQPPSGTVTDFNLKMFGKHGVGIYATLSVPGNPKNITEVVTEIEKCAGEVRNSNNCEHFARWKFPRPCHMLQKQGEIWTTMVDAFSPKLWCPMGGKTYKVENATYSVERMAMPVPLEGHLWTTRHFFNSADGGTVICFEIEQLFKRVRS